VQGIPELFTQVCSICQAVMATLAEEMSQLVGALAGNGPARLSPELHAAAEKLLAARRRAAELQRAEGEQLSEQQVQAWRQTLQPAASLAAAIQRCWVAEPHQGERQAAEQVLLAQAATLRCCAQLRCPNLGGEGREAQGRPNLACAGCRTARYCSARCQREAWREGHKHMCGLLAAAQLAALRFMNCEHCGCKLSGRRGRTCCSACRAASNASASR